MRVSGKIALVTGAASGLGAAIARRLSQEGARVVVTDIQVEAGRALAGELGGTFLEQDVTDERRWQAVVNEVELRYGALHALVNSAGIGGRFDIGDPEHAAISDWRGVQRVNVEGVFLGCRTAIPALRRAGGGAIVNIASTAALGPTPDCIAYGASKAAVSHLTKSVALHCAKNGSKIRCNSVHPGLVLTPMLLRICEELAAGRGVALEKVLHDFKLAVPQGEFQEPEDVASAVLFLASDEARHVTGIQLIVDGGASL